MEELLLNFEQSRNSFKLFYNQEASELGINLSPSLL